MARASQRHGPEGHGDGKQLHHGEKAVHRILFHGNVVERATPGIEETVTTTEGVVSLRVIPSVKQMGRRHKPGEPAAEEEIVETLAKGLF